MPSEFIYQPRYLNSWALVIGINQYDRAPPLGYARQDAEEVAQVFIDHLGFPCENVRVLLDAEATRNTVSSSFLRYSGDFTTSDDRIVIFFAGHGATQPSRRGEVGYLVPCDGDLNDLSTLIRWDELTRNAELFRAKHVLFLMDACYGGLAVTRTLKAGSTRFLKDMLQRYSRQVLTAGKANELVADAGGPRPGHSIFTGYLLDALEGSAADAEGILSANGVMAYVYERVGKDPNSSQSPHYGFLDGDGDLILSAPNFDQNAQSTGIDEDVVMQIPEGPPITVVDPPAALASSVKKFLVESRHRIDLDDLATSEMRKLLNEVAHVRFSVQAEANASNFAERLVRYEAITERLCMLTGVIAHWGDESHEAVLQKLVSRLGDANELSGGNSLWLGLRWYPLTLLMYYGGISAIAGNNYRSLTTLLLTKLGPAVTTGRAREAIVPAVGGMLDVKRTEAFKSLPGFENFYAPESEYLFKMFQPSIEDLLFLGKTYEQAFDRFEVLQALVYAYLTESDSHFWGPPGRFAWKDRTGHYHSPLAEMEMEAKTQGDRWAPVQFGLFGSSADRFKQVAEKYRKEMISRLPWY